MSERIAGTNILVPDTLGEALSGVAGPTAPGLFSAAEVARTLGLSERTVRRAIRRGDLVATRQGRHVRITTEALEQFRLHRRASSPPRPRPLLTLVPRSAEPPSLVLFPATERTRLAGLPAPLTRFIGRERETAEVAALLRRDDVRLVTLTGPGGVGKTRLALQVATGLIADLADGAAFVPLAPVRSAELVLATIALALGARDGDDKPPLDRLRAFLRDREALLVLDNFEQVLVAGPTLVDLLGELPAPDHPGHQPRSLTR